MANLSLTRVNQKLAQAKLAILSASSEQLTQVHLNSLMEAAAFHLMCAYQHYLREIAETYGLKQTLGLRTEADLANAFIAAAKQPSEAEELSLLTRNSQSWLAQLQRYYDSLWAVPVQATYQAEDAQVEDALIPLVNLEPVEEVTLESISSWHKAFVELAMRQRQTSAEF
jgi:hypothetical protein